VERDVRYLLVGVVVLALMVLFVGFIIWQAGGLRGADTERYTVFSEAGIAGLENGDVVRYLGVRVGQVDEIRLSAHVPGRVEIDIQVQRDVAVTRDTVATVRPEGITGQSYLGLRTPDPGAAPPEIRDGSRYPVITATRAPLDLLMDEAPQLVGQIAAIAEGLEALLDEDNRARVARMLEDVAGFTARLDDLGDSIAMLAASSDQALGEATLALGEIRDTAGSAGPAFEEAGHALVALRELSERLEELIARNEAAVDAFAREGLGEAGGLVRDARRALNEFERLATQLSEDPSQLIRRRDRGGFEVPQ
jgi:phospholipid/cholesterol/gamma-HCH transport system substrate-binding protein